MRFKSKTMTQCELLEWNINLKGRCHSTTIAWIESNFARVDNILRDEDGVDWKVMKCYAIQPTQYILDHERDYTKQREASDI